MKYDVNYFIAKFENISEDKWCTGLYNDGDHFCAYGHCGVRANQNFEDAEEANDLLKISLNYDIDVAAINDGLNERYLQPTPKCRILAALYDIKIKEQKTIIKYVAVSEKIRNDVPGVLEKVN